LVQVNIFGFELTITVVWGLDKLRPGVGRWAVIIHIPHICTLKWGKSVRAIAAGVTVMQCVAEGKPVTEEGFQANYDTLQGIRKARGFFQVYNLRLW
jgi:hypothetical protein